MFTKRILNLTLYTGHLLPSIRRKTFRMFQYGIWTRLIQKHCLKTANTCTNKDLDTFVTRVEVLGYTQTQLSSSVLVD